MSEVRPLSHHQIAPINATSFPSLFIQQTSLHLLALQLLLLTWPTTVREPPKHGLIVANSLYACSASHGGHQQYPLTSRQSIHVQTTLHAQLFHVQFIKYVEGSPQTMLFPLVSVLLPSLLLCYSFFAFFCELSRKYDEVNKHVEITKNAESLGHTRLFK